jgi:hypothetical protein
LPGARKELVIDKNYSGVSYCVRERPTMTLSSQLIKITLLFTIATYFLSGKPFDLKVFLYDNIEKIRNNELTLRTS